MDNNKLNQSLSDDCISSEEEEEQEPFFDRLDSDEVGQNRCKRLCKKCGPVSFTKKLTGSLYVNGRGYYTSLIATNTSLVAVAMLLFILTSKFSKLG